VNVTRRWGNYGHNLEHFSRLLNESMRACMTAHMCGSAYAAKDGEFSSRSLSDKLVMQGSAEARGEQRWDQGVPWTSFFRQRLSFERGLANRSVWSRPPVGATSPHWLNPSAGQTTSACPLERRAKRRNLRNPNDSDGRSRYFTSFPLVRKWT
jgi:hypothetical protein